MKIEISSLCKIGGRDYNQDFVDSYVGEKSAALVVCDGLGSYFGSDVASRLAATTITAAFSELASSSKIDSPINPELIKKYVKLAQNTIINAKAKHPAIKSSCTTIAGIFTNFGSTVAAHIGDSRVLMFRNEKLHFYTSDHSLAMLAVERGEIKRSEVHLHQDQNKLTRVLGSDYYSPPDTTELGELKSGDRFVICTDGFWEYVYEPDMIEILKGSKTPADALTRMEVLIGERADSFNDNYSAIVAFVRDK